ncbi:hypothetical protein NE236_09670 [Actinoallomurus purpureus]|uniref:hypothetical protein n=1 Tax=Actinoallomurus purpureus TaxID=478114 RepID=UPI002093B1B4|nr:hypothetical protein [Actinoallomurus purpureus]MCO6005253.1 hypothetical protein [Actinoallomurus purpureus]
MDIRTTRGFRKAAAALLGVTLITVPINAAPASASGDEDFKAFSMSFDIGDLSNTNECIPAWVTARYRDASGSDTWTRLVRTNTNGCDSDPEHLQKFGDFQNTHSRVNLLGGPKPAQHLHWKDLTSLTLTVTTPNTPVGRQKNVKIIKENIWAQDTDNNWHELFNEQYEYIFSDGFNDFEMFVKH